MGSSAAQLLGKDRGNNIFVPSITLDKIAEDFSLTQVDFIKCDIEGGETKIFNSPKFFTQYRPKIIIECHFIHGICTAAACQKTLNRFGYTCELIEQKGYPLPLLVCIPQT